LLSLSTLLLSALDRTKSRSRISEMGGDLNCSTQRFIDVPCRVAAEPLEGAARSFAEREISGASGCRPALRCLGDAHGKMTEDVGCE
ncbi:MAG: hypothetical protein WB774_02895, partial [Xanthobacteraceae bacterium]